MKNIRHTTDPEKGVVYGARGRPVGRVTKNGYVRVHSGRVFAFAHRLIWIAAHGPIPDGMQINHINGVKTDNRLCNLELATCSENVLHAFRLGLKSAEGERNGNAKLSSEAVRSVRASAAPSTALAKQLGVTSQTIAAIRRGRTWANEEASS